VGRSGVTKVNKVFINWQTNHPNRINRSNQSIKSDKPYWPS